MIQNLYTKVLIYLFAFVIGACIGSAALCFFDRKRRGEAWTKGHSHCTSCGHELKTRDLIPVVSYLSLHGKCRYCHTPYPMATFLSEMSSGIAFVFAAVSGLLGLKTGNLTTGVAEGLIFVLLAIASANDICCHECEYVIQFGIFGVGALYALLFGTVSQLLAGCIVCVLLLLISFVYRKVTKSSDSIGFADVIVLTGVACVLPPIATPLMLFLTCVLSILALPLARSNQKMQQIVEEQEGVGLLPFVLFGMFFALVIYKVYLADLNFLCAA